MKEIAVRLIEKYDALITELETLDTEHREFLTQATSNKNVLEKELTERMSIAKENLTRLQSAKLERELLKKHL